MGLAGSSTTPAAKPTTGGTLPSGAYTVGLTNNGVIQVVPGQPGTINGTYGPGNYLFEFQTSERYGNTYGGPVYTQYTDDTDNGSPVYLRNDSGGSTFLTNTGSILGNGVLLIGGTIAVNNSGFITSIEAIVDYGGTVLNSGTVSGYSYAIKGGSADIVNTGLLSYTATGRPGAILAITDGSVTNQGTILGGVSAGALVNSKLITGGGDNALVNSYRVSNLGSATILATGSATAIAASGTGMATIVNAGLVVGAQTGIVLEGGSINNLPTGTISASGSVAVGAGGYATLKNAGTILATGQVTQYFPQFSFQIGGAAALDGGGTLINQAGASIMSRYGSGAAILGYYEPGYLLNTDATLLNFGTILGTATGQAGAEIAGNGTVVNGVSGVVEGGRYGVILFAGQASLSNAGTIAAGPISAGGGTVVSVGIDFSTETTNSYVTNAATGTIMGGAGVLFAGADAELVNAGTIVGRARLTAGVTLADGGTVVNQLGGTIGSSYLLKSYGVAVSGAEGTVTNLGTIFGRTKAVYLGAGGTIDNGGSIGVVSGTAGYAAIQLVGTQPSTVINAGTIGTTGATVEVNGITAFGGLYLSNRPSGLIAGTYGVRSTSGASTILNSGTITTAGTVMGHPGTSLQAVYLSGTAGADYVSNAAGGLIYGYRGIDIEGALGTVANAGTIGSYRSPVYHTGTTEYLNLHGPSVVLGAGGSLDNSGIIQSIVTYYPTFALLGQNSLTSVVDVTNSGSIFGLTLPSGTLTNQAGGLIADVDPAGVVTVVNGGTIFYERDYRFGVITRGTAFGDKYNYNADSLMNLSGGVIEASGTVRPDTYGGYGHTKGQAVYLRNAYVSNAGTILANGIGIDVTAGTVVNSGLVSVTGSAVVIGHGTLLNSGKLLAAAGSYLLEGGDVFSVPTVLSYGAVGVSLTTGTVVNSGLIRGDVEVASGAVYNNAGQLIQGRVSGGASGAFTLVNSGTIGLSGTSNAVSLHDETNRLVVEAGAGFIGTIVGGGGTLEFASGTGRLASFGSGVTGFASVEFDSGAAWTAEGSAAGLSSPVFSGFGPNDAIEIDGFVAQNSIFLNGVLSLTSASQAVVSLNIAGGFTTASFTVAGDGAGGTEVTVACFAAGTLIRLPGKEVAVEDLAIGDMVLTASGAARPVHWLGRRSYGGRFLLRNPRLLPIRIAAGALGHAIPTKDLFVSPDHALLIDGLLIPAGMLVNGTSIRRASPMPQVDYIHVELASHDAILANGAPAETFLDDDSRGIFHNASEFDQLYPDAPPPGPFCAPRRTDGFEVEAVRQRLDTAALAV